MNNEPVACIQDLNEVKRKQLVYEQGMDWKDPLYTHPAKELNDGGEQVKNATYWKRQYNEMSSLNDRLKSSLYHANEQIKYLESHPAKTLTDEEILDICIVGGFYDRIDDPFFDKKTGAWSLDEDLIEFARAILRKAQEK